MCVGGDGTQGFTHTNTHTTSELYPSPDLSFGNIILEGVPLWRLQHSTQRTAGSAWVPLKAALFLKFLSASGHFHGIPERQLSNVSWFNSYIFKISGNARQKNWSESLWRVTLIRGDWFPRRTAEEGHQRGNAKQAAEHKAASKCGRCWLRADSLQVPQTGGVARGLP